MELLDQFGNPIRSTPQGRPADGVRVEWEPSDRTGRVDVSRGLTPELVDQILTQANVGITDAQCRLSAEIEEKNWDIAQALQTRRLAVAALEWEFIPGDDSPKAQEAAERLEAMLTAPPALTAGPESLCDSFAELVVYEMMGALLPGFSVTEIAWAEGGARIAGFNPVEQRHFTFQESQRPRLMTLSCPLGLELPPHKFIYHRHRARGGDASRGGLIRPLAWLDVFMRLGGMKDLLRFIERYGMPFIVAKLNQTAWANDRQKIQQLIRNFGSDGGGVFTDAVTTELLEASNSSGDVYFKLLDYGSQAITKVVLGQVGTTGQGPGGINNGASQENVRKDILAGDARLIGSTLTSQLSAPWTQFNFGPSVPPPRIRARLEEAVDLQAESTTLVNLANAGWEVEDPQEVSDKFGYKMRRKATGGGVPPPPVPPAEGLRPVSVPPGAEAAPADATALAAESGKVDLVPSVPASWDAPLRATLAEIEAKAADKAVSDADLLAFVEAKAAGMPALLRQMDVQGLATAFEFGMVRAAISELSGKSAIENRQSKITTKGSR